MLRLIPCLGSKFTLRSDNKLAALELFSQHLGMFQKDTVSSKENSLKVCGVPIHVELLRGTVLSENLYAARPYERPENDRRLSPGCA